MRKALKRIVDDVDEQKPDDIAYVYSGYAPLSIRLVQCIIQKPVMLAAQAASAPQGRLVNSLSAFPNAMGWRGFEEPLKLVRGKTFDEIQKQEDKAIRAKRALLIHVIRLTLLGLLNGAENKATIVFFLGGCTYTEIAALRFIAQHEGKIRPSEANKPGKRLIIATTGIINGNMMVEAALKEFQKSLA